MTPRATVSVSPQLWDEDRLREVVRAHKPFTPALRVALERLYKSARAYEQAQAEHMFNAAMTGAPDPSRLRNTVRRLAKARTEALIALGEDPDSSIILPAVPVSPSEDR